MALTFRPQLRTLLLLVNVLILLLPIGGVGLLKIYESELIRQTESALIGQAALLSAMYAQELSRQADQQKLTLDYSVTLPADSLFHSFSQYTPINPRLDVATAAILASSPTGLEPDTPSDTMSLAAGSQLEPVLRDSQRITLCGIRLLDSRGVVVASSGSEYGLSLANRTEVLQALRGYYSSVLRKRISDEQPPAFSSYSRKGWVRVLVAMPVIHGQKVVGAVLLSRSPLGVGKGLYFIRKHLLLAGLVILALVISITWFTNAVISRPLKRLVAKTKEVEVHGGKLAPLDHPGTFEVAELSKSIAEMADTLQTRANYIQNFARHVSHEFKTPIASMQGSVELMQDMDDEMSKEERRKFLGNIGEDVRHLDRLTQGLLELARADMIAPDQTSSAPEHVLQEVADYCQTPDHEVLVDLQQGATSVAMAADVLRGILVNLVDNSLSHGQASVVTISCRSIPTYGSSMVQITVTDNGIGIPAANRKKIFTPFFTTARNRGGTGLGLAISKALTEGHGGEITLRGTKGGGSQFQILLPEG